ncbi:MAG: MBOAT family O-acyltransferase, partial [Bacilli bacterium]
MIFSSWFSFYCGKKIDETKEKKKYLLISIIANLGILGFFKYADFLIGSFNSLLNINIPLLRIGLPIGISFFTFQIMSYTIDIYRKEVKAEKSFLIFLTYVSMFPQLIAGPIVRYETVSKELHKRNTNFKKFSDGFLRFLRGLFKKVLIANNIGYLFTLITSIPNNEISVLSSWLAIIAFSFQIYFDFSGYSDMAIGMGRMLGFTFLENFNFPYIATSITDFWRRWHISLSSFFRDYLYIPLGGSRVSKLLNIRNILIVWILTGLWHGAAWNFILW